MYKKAVFPQTTITRTDSTQGETIEQKLRRIKANKEPMTDGAPMIYTDASEGVREGTDIREDKFDKLVAANDKSSRNAVNRRKTLLEELNKTNEEAKSKQNPATGANNDGTSD